jgi:hypothetical protein
MRTPLRIGKVVLWGKSFTANETASLNTSLLTSNFTEHLLVDLGGYVSDSVIKVRGATAGRLLVKEVIKLSK